jgi:GDPmannose 4,6-dehydratase
LFNNGLYDQKNIICKQELGLFKIMRAVIFGAGGQDGFYLSELLREKEIDVIGISRKGNFMHGDVSKYEFVKSTIKEHQPDYVFHLAANSTTRHNVLFENHETISTGTLNILEAVRLHSPHSKIFLSGSAMQFKNEGRPINEKTAFEASSAYSVARIQSVYAGRYYRERFRLKVYVGYFFNHDSPLRTEHHVNQKIVKAVQRIAKGSEEILELGNIDVQKEFGFAGDIVAAVWILINQENVFEAVIGTGKAYSIRDWVIQCFEKTGLNWSDHVVVREDFIPEYKTLVSNPELIKSLGWETKVGLKELSDVMMLN